jgi:hypothetical protein
VNDITLLDSWVIFAQGHFNKNTDVFARKSIKSCPMKAVVRDGHWFLTTVYVKHNGSNGSIVRYRAGLEMDVIRVVLQQMNMMIVHVHTPEGFQKKFLEASLFSSMFANDVWIAFGDVGSHVFNSFFDTTIAYYIMSVRSDVPCSDKYPRWISVFRILSVELWLVLIISIVTATILTTLVS